MAHALATSLSVLGLATSWACDLELGVSLTLVDWGLGLRRPARAGETRPTENVEEAFFFAFAAFFAVHCNPEP